MVSLSEITLEADGFAARLAAQLADEPENRVQGMPSDGDSRAGYEAMDAAGWIGEHGVARGARGARARPAAGYWTDTELGREGWLTRAEVHA